jgi:hypothetical protein
MGAAWDRMKGETFKAFRAFTLYFRMPPESRSIVGAYRQGTGRTRAKEAAGTWTAWSAKYLWRERAEAHDDYLLERERKLLEAQRIKSRQKQLEAGEWLIRTGLESLQAKPKKGKELVPVVVPDPKVAKELVDVGVKTVRLALGDSTENSSVKHSGAVVLPTPPLNKKTLNLAALTDEQLEALAGILEGVGAPDEQGADGGTDEEKPS